MRGKEPKVCRANGLMPDHRTINRDQHRVGLVQRDDGVRVMAIEGVSKPDV
jgi:hypothetical protein